MKTYKQEVEYYLIALTILLSLFGGIFFSGWLSGVHWHDYLIPFSWDMFNIRELKQLVGIH